MNNQDTSNKCDANIFNGFNMKNILSKKDIVSNLCDLSCDQIFNKVSKDINYNKEIPYDKTKNFSIALFNIDSSNNITNVDCKNNHCVYDQPECDDALTNKKTCCFLRSELINTSLENNNHINSYNSCFTINNCNINKE